MEQMLVNLLKNGIEAIRETGKDRGVITIRIAAIKHIPPEEAADYNLKPWAKWVKIEIEDNGCGIPAENLGKLTSLFTTKTDRKANGGIGLYIAMRLLKIHEGCMGINSTEGKGTTITLYLPEWAAYQAYVLGHPDAMKESYDFDDDIAAVHTSEGDLQETHAIAE
jgi:signal transduction histidine kinase